jgi:hypothetical protein
MMIRWAIIFTHPFHVLSSDLGLQRLLGAFSQRLHFFGWWSWRFSAYLVLMERFAAFDSGEPLRLRPGCWRYVFKAFAGVDLAHSPGIDPELGSDVMLHHMSLKQPLDTCSHFRRDGRGLTFHRYKSLSSTCCVLSLKGENCNLSLV